MNPASQHLEGKLLDYAYGELSEGEAKTVEAHLRACPQCADSLTAMKQVRRMMSQLPIAAAPQAGLESLLTYAQKAAETARARPARRRRWLLWVAPIASVAALSVVLLVSSKVIMLRRSAATLAFKQDDTRGDWESPPQLSAKEEAETAANLRATPTIRSDKAAVAPATEQKVAGEDEAPAQEAKARAPKDWKGAGAPVAAEPGAPPAAERLARQTNGRPAAGVGDEARKVKVAAAPKPKPARRAAAPSDDGEGVEGGVEGGVVGGVLGAAPASKPSGDTVAGGTAGQLQQSPAKVGSQDAADSVELKQTPSASHERSSTPSSAEPPSDRERELAQLQQALAAGAQGQERARLLRRLCEVLDALGRTRDADSACDTVVREFPASKEAKSALDRLKDRAEPRR